MGGEYTCDLAWACVSKITPLEKHLDNPYPLQVLMVLCITHFEVKIYFY